VNDKLYLNLTKGINDAWINIGQRGIKSGDKYWPNLVANMGKKDSYWND
jgi:hypothetical protein